MLRGGWLVFAFVMCAAAQEPVGLLDAARGNAATFVRSLPDFLCNEQIQRFESAAGADAWRLNDLLSVKVIYRGGKEEYQLLSVNGMPSTGPLEAAMGTTSRGEFGSWLNAMFDPETRAQFAWVGLDSVGGRGVGVYSFSVARAHSSYELDFDAGGHVAGLVTAYAGLLSIDLASKKVLRIAIQAREIPPRFPMRASSTEIEYGVVGIGGRDYVLPVLSVTRTATSTTEYRNEMTFSDYRKFDTSARIAFGDSAAADVAPGGETIPPPVAFSDAPQRAMLDEARRAATGYLASLPEFGYKEVFEIFDGLPSALWPKPQVTVTMAARHSAAGETASHLKIDAQRGTKIEWDTAHRARSWNVEFGRLAANVLAPIRRRISAGNDGRMCAGGRRSNIRSR